MGVVLPPEYELSKAPDFPIPAHLSEDEIIKLLLNRGCLRRRGDRKEEEKEPVLEEISERFQLNEPLSPRFQLKPEISGFHGEAQKKFSKERVEEALVWASRLASEVEEMEPYLWSEPVKRLLSLLKNAQGGLYGLIGAQGIGKTRALVELERAFGEKAKFVKWSSNMESLIDALIEDLGTYIDFIYEQLSFTISYDHKLRQKIIKMLGYEPSIKKLVPLLEEEFGGDHEALEKLFTANEQRKLRRKWLLSELSELDVLLIDLRDYNKMSTSEFSHDLMEIYELWSELLNFNRGEEPVKLNIVITLQKELLEKVQHIFLGKMTLIELTPLREEELIQLYHMKFGDSSPFTDEALKEIARRSGGIPRMFKKIIASSIEKWLNLEHPPQRIDLNLLQDKENQTPEAIFEKGEKVLALLSRGQLYQREISVRLGLTPVETARLLIKLEAQGLITRKPVRGGKVVSLAKNFSARSDENLKFQIKNEISAKEGEKDEISVKSPQFSPHSGGGLSSRACVASGPPAPLFE